MGGSPQEIQQELKGRDRVKRLIYQSFFVNLGLDDEHTPEWVRKQVQKKTTYKYSHEQAKAYLEEAKKLVIATGGTSEHFRGLLLGVLADIYSNELSGEIFEEELFLTTSFFLICRELEILSSGEVLEDGSLSEELHKTLFSGVFFQKDGWM